MATPKEIVEGGGLDSGQPEAPPTEALQNLIGKIEDAVTALQDGAALLKEKAAQLANHERVLADKGIYGHFKAGSGFKLNSGTGAHDVDFQEGVEALVAPAVDEALNALDPPSIARTENLNALAGATAEGLAAKADKTDVDAALATKADKSSVESAMATKADKASVSTKFAQLKWRNAE